MNIENRHLFVLLFLGLDLLFLFRTQLSLFLFFSFALVFASATVAHVHFSSVRLDARNAVHTSIADAPNGRAMESRPSDNAKIIGFPRVGGLHHRYAWREAA